MKKILYLLAAVVALTMVSCGEDDPVIPRDRDIQFNTFELFHIGGTAPTTSLQSCDITIHRKTSTADITIKIAPNGTVQTFALTGVALTYDEDKNIYTARTATTSDPRVTNFVALLDCNDYIAEMSFLLDGTMQVTGTSNQLFYNPASTTMTFSDGTSGTHTSGNYLFTLHPDGSTADINIGDLVQLKDTLRYGLIQLEGLPLTVTTTGYHIASDEYVTEKGQYYRYDPKTGSDKTALGDSLFLRFENLQADLNVMENSMTGSWTMIRLKRVTDTISRNPLETQQRIIEVSRAQMRATGSIH